MTGVTTEECSGCQLIVNAAVTNQKNAMKQVIFDKSFSLKIAALTANSVRFEKMQEVDFVAHFFHIDNNSVINHHH